MDLESANLIRLTACFSNLSYNDIGVDIPVYLRIALYTNKAMFLTVVEPMARAPCSYNSL